METVERWGMLEVSVNGPTEGNPFTEQSFFGTFTSKNEKVRATGFYDGEGVYKVRFMPSFEALLTRFCFTAPASRQGRKTMGGCF